LGARVGGRDQACVGGRSNLDKVVLTLAPMTALTIQQASETTGWSPRMLRYVERLGLVRAARSPGGYRLYGAEHLQRLRTLRELLATFDIGLSDVGFAARLRHDGALQRAIEDWLDTTAQRPDQVSDDDWLRWEQDKHRRLLERFPGPLGVERIPGPLGVERIPGPLGVERSETTKETA
jgi:MerR family copper efflux transcriptional regulator